MPGRGRRRERARPPLFLSPAATSAAELLEGEASRLASPVASISRPLGRLPGPVASLRGHGHLPRSFPRLLPRSGSARPRERSVPELPAVAGSPPPPSPHASEGPLTPCSLPQPGACEEGARIAAFALARRPLQAPATATGAAGRAGPRWSPELAPNPRPPKFASLPFRGGGSAPRGGRCLGLWLGVWRPPGFG